MVLKAELTIDTGAPSVRYSPMLFGGFLEHFHSQVYGGIFDPGSPLADRNGFRRDVIEALKELSVPVVRWPGGCYASGYHWENGVGGKRTPSDDMAWGVVEPNTFGIGEFVEYCRLLGWAPYICNNAGNGTVDEMKAWVEYCNAEEGGYARMRRENGHGEPLRVDIWSIGNENWGGHEIGNKPIEEWAPLVLEAAEAMKAADPSIRLTAAALPTREWTLPLLKAAGRYLDYISVHQYWLPLWQENAMPDYLSCIMKSESPERTITGAVEVLEESGYRGRIKIAFDEWNLRGWHHPGFPRKTVQDYGDPAVGELIAKREANQIPSQYTMADALFSASFFNACLRHAGDVGMANIAPLVNTRGPLHVHPDGIVRRTHFHTMAMYANGLEALVARSTIEADPLTHGSASIPVLDAAVTVDGSGRRFALALVNRHPTDEVRCTVKPEGTILPNACSATILSGDSPDAYNDITYPDRVRPVRAELRIENDAILIPAHSLVVLGIDRGRDAHLGQLVRVQRAVEHVRPQVRLEDAGCVDLGELLHR